MAAFISDTLVLSLQLINMTTGPFKNRAELHTSNQVVGRAFIGALISAGFVTKSTLERSRLGYVIYQRTNLL